jgi:hypothetical protein
VMTTAASLNEEHCSIIDGTIPMHMRGEAKLEAGSAHDVGVS